MSEYQYYEFRAIDHPLTEEQKEEVASLSSRAYVTSHQASFVYNYGDFRGNEEQLMTDHFDIMLYMANWGTRRLMFRIPCSLIDMKQVAPFCISEEIDHWPSEDKENIILDLNFDDEEQADWIEGEGWLDELVSLREELIQGDLRVLYLAWLKAAKKALEMEEIDKDTLEPPVPYGLRQLSNPQKVYIRFLDIDTAMIEVAAQQSEEQQNEEIKTEKWIDKLSEEEKHEFLVRLSHGERNLSILFNKRLHGLAVAEQPQKKKVAVKRRTISTLIELAEKLHQKKKEEERKKAELAHQKKLESLANKKNQVWNDIYALIEEKKSNSYDKAVEFLNALHELSQYQGELEIFREHIEKIQRTYSNRSALLRRMRSSRLIEE
jgi:hypothetical protein